MSDRLELRGGRALVTGAGVRVGRAIAVALGRAGMRVGVHYSSSREGAEVTLREIETAGGDGVLLSADLSERENARALVDSALAALGGLDLFVLSAANFERVDVDAIDDAAWDRSMSLNLGSQFALAQRAISPLRASRGSMVFITCASATTPFRHYLPYVVSKGALRHMVKTLALELAPDIRVNAVAPGTVLPAEDMPKEKLSRLVERIPLRRAGDPRDVADAVIFLARSPFITGHEIVIDGGRTVAAREG
jgi:pteridine reductase